MSSKQTQFSSLLRQSQGTGEQQKEEILTGIIVNEENHEQKTVHETIPVGSLMGEKVLKEDTHTRQTYMIENTVLTDLNNAARGKKKGFKTEVVNLGIKLVLDQMKKNK